MSDEPIVKVRRLEPGSTLTRPIAVRMPLEDGKLSPSDARIIKDMQDKGHDCEVVAFMHESIAFLVNT